MKIVELGCLVGAVAGMAVLGLVACGRSGSAAKVVEAKQGVMDIAGKAQDAYARETMPTTLTAGAAATPTHAFCLSAKGTVPSSPSAVRGVQYVSKPADWGGSATEGWQCLKFSIATPQSYAFGYTSDGKSFTATAQGDLNGDGKLSSFSIGGRGENGAVMMDPVMKETDPTE